MEQVDYTVYKGSCPDRALWEAYGKKFCPDQSNYVRYHCLAIGEQDNFTDICLQYLQFSRGVYPVVDSINRFNMDARECPPDRYQPSFIFTNDANTCLNQKSRCNEEGQVIFSNGSTTTDRSCRCDYTQGYTYVTPPRNGCSCVPSEEDCSCYLMHCGENHVLNQDYKCSHVNDTSSGNITYQCAVIVVREEENDKSSIDSPDDGILSSIPKIDNRNRIQANSYIIVSICVLVMVYGLGLFFKNQYRKKGTLKFPTPPLLSYGAMIGDKIEVTIELVGENKLLRWLFGPPVISEVVWEKDGQPLDRYWESYDRKPYLTIDRIRPDDTGVYRCFAKNQNGDICLSEKIKIEAIGSPAFYSNVPEYITVQGRKALDSYKTMMKTEVTRQNAKQLVFIGIGLSGGPNHIQNLLGVPWGPSQTFNKVLYNINEDKGLDYRQSKFDNVIRSKFDEGNGKGEEEDNIVDFSVCYIPCERKFSSVVEAFLSPDAVFILMIDVSQELYSEQEKSSDSLFNVTENGGKVQNYLNLIHSFKSKQEDVSVVLVGIHTTDPLKIKKASRFEKEVLNCMYPKHKAVAKHIKHTVVIPGKEKFVDHRTELMKEILELSKKTLMDDIPLRYLFLQDKLLEWSKTNPVVLIKDVLDFAKQLGYPVTDRQEIDSFLKYQHQIGNIVYYDTVSYVCLNKSWLFKSLVDVEDVFIERANIKDRQALLQVDEFNDKLQSKIGKHDIEMRKAIERMLMIVTGRVHDALHDDVSSFVHVPWMVDEYDDIKLYRLFSRDCRGKTSFLGLSFDWLPSSLIYTMIVWLMEKYPVCEGSQSIDKAIAYRSIVLSYDSFKMQRLFFIARRNELLFQIWFHGTTKLDLCFQSLRDKITDVITMYSDRHAVDIPYKYKLKCPDSSPTKDDGIEIPNNLLDMKKYRFPCKQHKSHDDLSLAWFDEAPQGHSEENRQAKVQKRLDFTKERDRKASVLGYPQITVDNTSPVVTLGERVTLTCRVTSNLPVSRVLWWRKSNDGDVLLTTLDRCKDEIPQCPTHVIESVSSIDEGIYWCEAKNSIGSSRSPEINLAVHDVIMKETLSHDPHSINIYDQPENLEVLQPIDVNIIALSGKVREEKQCSSSEDSFKSVRDDDGFSAHGKPVSQPDPSPDIPPAQTLGVEESTDDETAFSVHHHAKPISQTVVPLPDKTTHQVEEEEKSIDESSDAILMYMDKDQDKAEEFRRHLEGIVPDIKITLIDELTQPGKTALTVTNNLFSQGRYIFVLITEGFKLNMLQRYKSEKILLESLMDPEKLFRVVPVTMAGPQHIPEELVPLVDIKYYHYLEAKSKGKKDWIYIRTIKRLVDYGRKTYLLDTG